MTPGKLALEPFTEGDLWEGVPAFGIRLNGNLPPSPIESVTMRFKKLGSQALAVVELSSAIPTEISIISAANWEIEVPEQCVPGLTCGKWAFCIAVTPVGSVKRTYVFDTIDILETI